MAFQQGKLMAVRGKFLKNGEILRENKAQSLNRVRHIDFPG